MKLFGLLTSLHSKEIISFNFGNENFLGKNTSFDNYEINQSGLSFALNFPLNFQKVDAHVKAKIAHHNIKSENEKFYLFGSNEVLIGKEIQYTKKVKFLPQIGIGIFNEIITDNKDSEFNVNASRYLFFYDISFLTKYQFEKMDLGFLTNLEKGLSRKYKTNYKLNFSIIIII